MAQLTKRSKQFLKAAIEEQRRLEEAQARRLDALNRDPAFRRKTECIKQDLIKLRHEKNEIFRYFFKGFTYGLISRPRRLATLLSRIKDDDARQVLRDYVKYAKRFQVRFHGLRPLKGPMKIDPFLVPLGPFWTKLHLRVRKRSLEVVSDEELRAKGEDVFPDLRADDEFDIPKTLEGLLREDHAKVVRVDDDEGLTVLSQLEDLAYRDDSLTFILHHTRHQNYIFCLVGEKVTTNTTWRHAGKVVTALQKQFYGRAKSGRPTNVTRKVTQSQQELGTPAKEPVSPQPTQAVPQSHVQTVPVLIPQPVVSTADPTAALPKPSQPRSNVDRKLQNRRRD